MIVKKIWYKTKWLDDNKQYTYTLKFVGYFLFGIIPIYIKREEDN